MQIPNYNKLTTYMLLALSFLVMYMIGKKLPQYAAIITPKMPQFYFLSIMLFLFLMLIFNLMHPVYHKGLKHLKSVKLKKHKG